MVEFSRRAYAAIFSLFAIAIAAALAPGVASAQGLFSQPKYAAIVVDASSGEVLYSKRADAERYPASISKIMTLYLTFEALSTGKLSLSEPVMVSSHAASMIPSKSSLRPGQSLTVDQAIRIVAVHSANDIAVALAEKIGGSEPRFAQMMTLRAQELGMSGSRFVNASGVPDNRQVSTARDIAVLCRAVMRDYPQYYGYFGIRDFALDGKLYTNHNHLLREPGYDGFKTGYTNAAGFNLAASMVQDGRRLITVVMGGSSGAARDDNVETLMNAGFDVMRRRAIGQNTTIAMNIAEPDDASGPVTRPVMEQGSGDQPGLNVELTDPGFHAPPTYVAANEVRRPAPVIRARAVAAEDCRTVVKRGRHGRTARSTVCARRVEVASTDCSYLKHSARRRACERQARPVVVAADDCAGKRGHARRRCEGLRPALAVEQTASACAHKHGRALKACERHDEELALAKPGRHHRRGNVAALDSSDEAKSGGGYVIQVGSFPNQKGAAAHLTKVAARYSGVLGGGAGKVTHGGAGYRARFDGFTASAAKAACARLAAKGERCLVMNAS